jgi:hypothetical protein
VRAFEFATPTFRHRANVGVNVGVIYPCFVLKCVRAEAYRPTKVERRFFSVAFSLAEAKENQGFSPTPRASRDWRVRFTKYKAEDFLEGEFFGGEVEDAGYITLAPSHPCACYMRLIFFAAFRSAKLP